MLKPFLLPLLILAPLIFFCVGVGEGTWQNPLNVEEIMLQIRLPRITVALLVGAALSASGSALQALFENPLADPSLIGTSGGRGNRCRRHDCHGLERYRCAAGGIFGRFKRLFIIVVSSSLGRRRQIWSARFGFCVEQFMRCCGKSYFIYVG